MSATEVFLDTNVLLYLVSGDSEKADRAENLLASGGTINVQVLNEFASVAIRKLGMQLSAVREILTTVRAICTVNALDADTHDLGLDLSSGTDSHSSTPSSSPQHSSPAAGFSILKICSTAGPSTVYVSVIHLRISMGIVAKELASKA